MIAEVDPEVEYGHHLHPVVHWLAPVFPIATVWLTRACARGMARVTILD